MRCGVVDVDDDDDVVAGDPLLLFRAVETPLLSRAAASSSSRAGAGDPVGNDTLVQAPLFSPLTLCLLNHLPGKLLGFKKLCCR